MRVPPILEVNDQLAGRGTLTFEYREKRIELRLTARYVRLLAVLFAALAADIRSGRSEAYRGFRNESWICTEIGRLPDGGYTGPLEVQRKVYGFRDLIRNALAAVGLPKPEVDDFIENEPKWGYRLGRELADLQIIGWSPIGPGTDSGSDPGSD